MGCFRKTKLKQSAKNRKAVEGKHSERDADKKAKKLVLQTASKKKGHFLNKYVGF